MVSAMGKRSRLKKTGKRTAHSRIRDQGGSILLALIITMVILSVLAAALLPTLFTSQMGQVSAGGAMKAYYLAEAGGRYILPRLNVFTSGEYTFKFSGGDTFFIINKISATEFTSTGVVFEGTDLESRVAITYKLSGGLFDYGVFGGEEVTFRGLVSVNGKIGTNGSSINPNFFPGETLVGKDMTPKSLPSGVDRDVAESEWEDIDQITDSITLEDGHQYFADEISLSGSGPSAQVLTISGDVDLWVDGPISFSGNARLRIEEGASLNLYAAGSTNFSDWAQVRFEEGASLTLYAMEDVSFSDQSGTNYLIPTVPADHFIVYGIPGCNNITFSDWCDISIGVYAPDADITISDFVHVRGSLVGETFTMTDLAHLTYDESLQSIGDSGTSTSVVQYFTPD